MVESTPPGRALLWVLAAVGAVLLLRLSHRSRTALARPAALAGGAALAVAASGIELGLLRPRRWAELGEGLARGAEALGGARLPYQGVDFWPGATLEVLATGLIFAAAYAAFWPRRQGMGWPGAALVLLLVLVVTPVTAMSVPAPLVLGVAVAATTACFLFLERLPVRPGAGAAVLTLAAVAVALPIGAAADRDEPWFDYKSFAEGLGPVEPVRFSWEHRYGPIDWPRDGRELFRAKADEPLYWKAESLAGFDGERWHTAPGGDVDGASPAADVADAAVTRLGWSERVEVSLRRLETDTLVGPGTILRFEEASRGIEAEWIPGRWITSRSLGRGDSYSAEAHVPQPRPSQLAAATTGWAGRQADALELSLPLRDDARKGAPELARPEGYRPQHLDEVAVRFTPFGLGRRPSAYYELADEHRDGVRELRRTHYWRTWRLSRRLRRDATSAWDYVTRVNAHLRSAPFAYTERPPAPAPGVPPLEAFLHEDRAGYCQQFSGAMALLLRMGGVPARVATGFSPGGFRKRRQEWIVRDIDAHSWVEAWFDDIGWVTVDPTPPATPARSQTAALEPPQETDDGDDSAVAPGEEASPPQAQRPEAPPSRDAEASGAGSRAEGGPPWTLIVAGLVLAAVGAGALRRRAAVPQAGELEELERALRRSGRPAGPGTTLAELESRLGGSAYLRALRAARFAGRPQAPTPAERAEFRRDLAAGLGWRGWLRALWALPPRPGGLWRGR